MIKAIVVIQMASELATVDLEEQMILIPKIGLQQNLKYYGNELVAFGTF